MDTPHIPSPPQPTNDTVRSVALATGNRRWMKVTLWLAAAYNILWGAWAILFPRLWFEMAGMPLPTYPEIWQCVGMIVGVYGVGYAIAATDPLRWWPLVLVGLLGKVLGPIGFVDAVLREVFPLSMAWTTVTNDLIWWLPFGLILFHARKDALIKRAACGENDGGTG